MGCSACIFYGRIGAAYNWPLASIFYGRIGPDWLTDGRTNKICSGKSRGRSLSFLWFFALCLASIGRSLFATTGRREKWWEKEKWKWMQRKVTSLRARSWEKKSHSNRRRVVVPSCEKNNKRNHCVCLSLETQVLKPRSWDPGPATWQQ